MSKINELIQQLCPKGVEFKKIDGLVNILDSKRKPISKAKRIYGPYPYYGANGVQDYVEDYIFDGTYLLLGEDGSVINKDGSPVLHWATGKIWVNNHAHILAEKENPELLLRFLFYALAELNVTKVVKGNIPKITQQNLKEFIVPIPPIQVQQEIVKILDQFTALDQELNNELQARKQQYSFYLNQLLSFEDKNVEFKALGEIGEFIRGNGLQKSDFTDSGVGCIHYGQIYTYYGLSTIRTKSFVSEELAKKLKKAQNGDLIIAGVSENIEDVCKAVVWLGNDEICISGDSFAYRHSQNPKYLAYIFQSKEFLKFKKKNAQGAKVTRLKSGSLPKFKIPVPSLEEQERIVKILDQFDTLVNDTTVGLPAEINARKQQYEYYRNQLLTFKPLD